MLSTTSAFANSGLPLHAKQTLDELLALERTLWDNDAGVYEATYTPDAVLIFPGVGRIDRETAVAAIQKENATARAWARRAIRRRARAVAGDRHCRDYQLPRDGPLEL
jgi:hypothetical protein